MAHISAFNSMNPSHAHETKRFVEILDKRLLIRFNQKREKMFKIGVEGAELQFICFLSDFIACFHFGGLLQGLQ